MDTSISIPLWPGCIDAVKWSQHNIIAIAGTETIAILTPRFRKENNIKPAWQHQVLKVNGFFEGELSMTEPLGLSRWSIGEELSQRNVEAIAWSPAGLGIFGSCCLAVLHSDHSLTLWECKGRPENKDDWRKCLTVNTIVEDFYRLSYPIKDARDAENNQVRQRIRSMTWDSFRTTDKSMSCRMAVSTEAGDVLLLRINSPYDVLSASEVESWTAAVEVQIPCARDLPFLDCVRHHDSAKDGAYIEHLQWSSSISEHGSHDILSFLAAEAVYLVSPGSVAEPALSSTACRRLSKGGVRAEGPLRISSDGRILLYFVEDSLVMYNIKTDDWQTHKFTRQWSEVSGLALHETGVSRLIAYPTTQLAYERLPQAAVCEECHVGDDQRIDTQSLLTSTIEEFVTKNEVCGGVHTRTWGIDTSPIGSDLIYCTYMIPAESITHIIAATQITSVFIHELDTSDSVEWHKSFEGSIHTLQARYTKLGATKLSGIISSLTSCYSGVDIPSQGIVISPEPGTAAMSALKERVLCHQERLQDVHQRLQAIITGKTYNNLLPASWYQALIEITFQHFPRYPPGSLSAKMLSIYTKLQAKLQPDASFDQVTVPAQVDERCSICDRVIEFEAIKWARCVAGHRFARCAITLLPIPRPAASKHCILCNTQYLSEYALSELRHISESPVNGASANGHHASVIEPAYSPIRTIFTVFTRCVLCNGRFVA